MILWLIFCLYATTAQDITVDLIPSTGTPPVRRLYSASVYFQEKLYFFGGQNSSGEMMNELHIFHPTTLQWERLEPIDGISPMGRMTFAMYASDSRIFVHGGLGTNGKLSDLWSYDAVSNTWQKETQNGEIPPPFHRNGYTDFTHNGTKYFVIGCFGTEDLAASSDLYLYDTTTSTWRKLPLVAKSGHTVPAARRMCTLNYYDGFLYQWGGNIYEPGTGAGFYRYDLTLEQWENVAYTGSVPQPRTFGGSGIYKDALYILPGWVATWGSDVDETWRFDLTQLANSGNYVWEQLQIEQIDNYSTYFPRDSYTMSLIGNNFYMHSGYSTLFPLSNFLIKLDLDQSPIGVTEICVDVDAPTNRYFASLTLVSGKFYLYGGSTGTEVLDELWVYDENLKTWKLQDTVGLGPGPRQGHAAVALENSLMIWGGRNGSNFYQDLFRYNTLTNVWEVVEVKSTINPTGAEGACMEVYNEDLYIFGGKNAFRANNYLWKFSFGTNQYTALSTGNYNSPNAIAFSTCYNIGNQIYIMYGLQDDTGSPKTIQIFNLETYQWTVSDLAISNQLASVASGKAGTSIIIANGSRWNNSVYNQVYIVDIQGNTIEKMYDLDWGAFAESSVYYKNSLYIFGGGASERDGAIRLTRSVNRFYKITFLDLPCSVGTYESNNECVPCPKGTYKDTYGAGDCKQCELGKYNEQIGATNVKTCIPCPEGTYNSQLGSYYCLNCPKSKECPTGTITPKTLTLIDDQFSDKQPESYESLAATAEEYILYVFLVLIALLASTILLIACSGGIRKRIPAWDMYIDGHNHDPDKVMVTKRTFVGGFCSIIGYLLLGFLTIQSLLYFFYDNIEEIKALIPIVVVKEIADPIDGNMNIKVTFYEYGGQCVTAGTEKQCVPEIQYVKAKITGSLSGLSCQADGNVCSVEITCTNCILDKSAAILFSSYEYNSYSTSIEVYVTSQSSVPDFDSEIKYIQTAQQGEVFRGSTPTIFHFQAIQSVFESEVRSDVSLETGYHLALGDLSAEGSSYTVENLANTRYLHAQIVFSQGDSALHTTRIYKIRNDTLILGIIGGVAGVFELVSIFMKPIEQRLDTLHKKFSKATKSDPKLYLDAFIKETDDDSNSRTPQTADARVLPFDSNGDADQTQLDSPDNSRNDDSCISGRRFLDRPEIEEGKVERSYTPPCSDQNSGHSVAHELTSNISDFENEEEKQRYTLVKF